MQRVSDSGIQSLCEGCAELESLSLSNCESLTDLALKKIAAHCHKLRYMYMYILYMYIIIHV